MLVMRHVGSDTDSLTCQIGPAAKLRVKEGRGGPSFAAWEPIPRRVETLARGRAKKALTAPPTAPTRASCDPAQAILANSRQDRRSRRAPAPSTG
jgi:hypothetical protein